MWPRLKIPETQPYFSQCIPSYCNKHLCSKHKSEENYLLFLSILHCTIISKIKEGGRRWEIHLRSLALRTTANQFHSKKPEFPWPQSIFMFLTYSSESTWEKVRKTCTWVWVFPIAMHSRNPPFLPHQRSRFNNIPQVNVNTQWSECANCFPSGKPYLNEEGWRGSWLLVKQDQLMRRKNGQSLPVKKGFKVISSPSLCTGTLKECDQAMMEHCRT